MSRKHNNSRRTAVLTVLAWLVSVVLLLGAPYSAGVVADQTEASVIVKLRPVGGARVHGTVTLTAAGAKTFAVLIVRRLEPDAHPVALIHTGTCSDLAHLSASTLFLPRLHENARGTARGSGRIHGPDAGGANDNVSLSQLTRSRNVTVIMARAHLVACGQVRTDTLSRLA